MTAAGIGVARVVLLTWLVGTVVATLVNSLLLGFDRAPAGEATAISENEITARLASVTVGREALALSLVSGVVAATALVPTITIGAGSGVADSPGSADGLVAVGFVVGLGIRVLGTVALFFAAGYYMPVEPEVIAAWLLGWHLLLLLAEVLALRRWLGDPTPAPTQMSPPL